MRIIIGADYRGYARKEELKAWLASQGHDVTDVGADSDAESSFVPFAVAVARATAADPEARGVVICGSGAGVAITANKVPGGRAVLATIPELAASARHADDANILALSADFSSLADAQAITEAFLAAPYERKPRRDARLAELASLERGEPT